MLRRSSLAVGRCRGGSACCRRRRRAAWSRHIRLAPPWPPTALRRPRLASVRARSSARSSSRASTYRRDRHARRSPTRPSRSALLRRRHRARRSCSTTAQDRRLARDHARARRARRPSRRCCPPTRSERKSVERAEQWGDEVLQPLARRVIWAALRRAPARDAVLRRGLEAAAAGARSRGSTRAAGRARRAAHQRRHRPRTCAPTSRTSTPTSRASTAGSSTTCSAASGRTPPTCRSARACALLLTIEDVAPRRRRGRRRSWRAAGSRDYPGRVPAGALPAAWLASERQLRLGRSRVRAAPATTSSSTAFIGSSRPRAAAATRTTPQCAPFSRTRSGGPERRTVGVAERGSASAADRRAASGRVELEQRHEHEPPRRDLARAGASGAPSVRHVAEQQHVDVDRPRPVAHAAGRAAQLPLDRLARVEQRLRLERRSRSARTR